MRRGLICTFVIGSLVAAACSSNDLVEVEQSDGSTPTVPGDVTPDDVAIDTPTTDAVDASETSEPPDQVDQPDPIEPASTTPADSGQDDPVDPSDPAPDGVGDSLYPQMGNGGYFVDHYDITLDVDAEANEIDATAVIEATSDRELTTFNLDLHELEITRLDVNGAPATFDREGDEVIITASDTIAEGAEFVVEVDYNGVPQPLSDPAVPFFEGGWNQRDDVIFVASDPSGASTWFPSNNHPSDKATFTVEITTDADLAAVSNGLRESRIDNGDGTATTSWAMNDQMTTYLATVYIGDFERREYTTDSGLLIRDYFPPEDADILEEQFSVTADVIEFYEELFGAPYPFEVYGSIVLPFATGFALENQTISVHGLDIVDAGTIAHEIMHQWTGNSVTVAQWQDIWLLEGFATYLSFMYFEDRDLLGAIEPRGMYAALDRAQTVGPAEVPIEELFGLSVYFRGGMTLHALRVEVGDETFREILGEYYFRNAGERASTDEFQAIVEELGGESALEVLNSWLFGTDLPDFPE